ncbi:hypothetical protein GGR57DRAFT_285359 [Xylariaceae sp. FL1272]|nr:hypothetical protein GGR57DRAFT_285359 [Xylariaceae sp. FL1272]
MGDDLRIKLGKSQVQPVDRSRNPFPPEAWIAAWRDLEAGTRPPPPRALIVIDPSGPIDSPETLQKLLASPSLPEVIETNEAHEFPVSTGKAVRVSQVSLQEGQDIRKHAEWETMLVWMPHRQTKEPSTRIAYIITSLKEANDKSDETEDKQSGMQDGLTK